MVLLRAVCANCQRHLSVSFTAHSVAQHFIERSMFSYARNATGYTAKEGLSECFFLHVVHL